MTDTRTEDPAAIEREIRRTQDDMSRTVEKIGNQFSIKNMVNALLDKADESNVDARMVLDGARRNPMALGLIAAGAIWLVSDKDAKLPSLPKGKNKPDSTGFSDDDVHHRDYVTHMSAIEMREGEDPIAYQRRRDIARSNYFMVERNHDEDDHSFRQRLDDVADKFREKRRAWSESSAQTGEAARQKATAAKAKASDMARRAQGTYSENPLVGGIIAAAVGAAFGSALPISRQEQEKLGAVGEKARGLVDQQKENVTGQLREKKDELLEKADEKLQSGMAGLKSGGEQPSSTPQSGFGEGGQPEQPFIIADQQR